MQRTRDNATGRVLVNVVTGLYRWQLVWVVRLRCQDASSESPTQCGKPQDQGEYGGGRSIGKGAVTKKKTLYMRVVDMKQIQKNTRQNSMHGTGIGRAKVEDTDTVAANCVDQDLTRSVHQSTTGGTRKRGKSKKHEHLPAGTCFRS